MALSDAQAEKLLGSIDETEITRICRALVRFQTINPPGHEEPAAAWVAGLLRGWGFETELVPLGEGRASALGRLRGRGGKPGLVFNGHVDVVPVGDEGWAQEPFEGRVAEGRVWGRGASDMKGGVAAMLVAAQAVAAAGLPLRGDLIFAATADEEAGMRGARSLTDRLGPVQGIIISEPTGNTVGLAERGVLWLELTTLGKTAHGSMPELGRNAVMMMVAVLAALDRLDIPYTRHPVLGDFTRSINTINGGVKTNVVPDRCVATVDMRTVPGQDHAALVRQIAALLERLGDEIPGLRARLEVLYDLPAVATDAQQPPVPGFIAAAGRALGQAPDIKTVRFATEASIYVPALGVPVVIFGPGDPALAHRPDEHIEIGRMVEAAKVYAQAAAELLL